MKPSAAKVLAAVDINFLSREHGGKDTVDALCIGIL